MSQPPYQPYPGEPGPESGGGYQPPAAPGSYPAPGQPPYPQQGQPSHPQPGGQYPPPDQGAYPPGGQYPPPSSGAPQYDGSQYGTPQSGAPQYDGSQYGTPQSGAPQYDGSQYGTPQSGAPQSGAPQYDASQYGTPQSGAPQYDASQYGTPQSGAPQYGAPQSGPPQYGTPQYGAPQSGAPQYGAPPAKKKSSALKIVLIVVGVVALLCIAGGVVAFLAAKDKVEDVVDAAKISVVEPQTLGGREKASDPTLQSSVSGLDSEMSKLPGSTGSVGAIYGDIQKQDLVMVAAASSISGSAQSRFDQFTSGLGQGGIAVKSMTDTDPGPLGGLAKCGDSNTAGVPMAVCVWSDNGSVGMIAMMFKKKADLEKEFISMRGEIEKKA
jgi:hypothetical protein